MPLLLRGATLGILVAAAGYLGASALNTVAPVAGGVVAEHAATALDTYSRILGLAAPTLVANAVLLTWASAGVSLWVAMRVTRGPLI